MTETKVDLITGLTFELTADGTAVQESTDQNSVVKEFSDDVEQIAQQVFEAMRFSAQRVNEPQPPEWVPKGNSLMQDHARKVARAILARWGHHPAPAAEGEAGGLVRQLRVMAADAESADFVSDAAKLTLAAALLEQRHPAPVPAATETHYEFCIYDADYIDQAGGTAPTYAQALSEGRHYLAQYQQDGPHTLELRRIEVLPPGAFPVPDDTPVPVLPNDAQVIEPTEHTLLVPVPTPVPVSERPPGPGEMTDDEEVWVECEGGSYSIADTGDYYWEPHTWILKPIDRNDIKYNRRWLPSYALPLPAGEAQP